jgi:hypothetical protein
LLIKQHKSKTGNNSQQKQNLTPKMTELLQIGLVTAYWNNNETVGYQQLSTELSTDNLTRITFSVIFSQVKKSEERRHAMSITIPLKKIIGKKPNTVAKLLKDLGIDTEKPYNYRMNAIEIIIEQ